MPQEPHYSFPSPVPDHLQDPVLTSASILWYSKYSNLLSSPHSFASVVNTWRHSLPGNPLPQLPSNERRQYWVSSLCTISNSLSHSQSRCRPLQGSFPSSLTPLPRESCKHPSSATFLILADSFNTNPIIWVSSQDTATHSISDHLGNT